MDTRSEMAENVPLVTVITSTLNLAKAGRLDVFKRCVESVRLQSYGNIEHLIIDGASEDGTLDVIRSLGLTVYSEPDDGIYDAFNKGLKRARGAYVAYLNSDDCYCTREAIKLSVDALLARDADWSYGHAYWWTQDHKLCFWEGTLRALPFGQLPCHQTVVAKKSVLEELRGFDLAYRNVADNLLMLRLHANGYKSACVDAPLVIFMGGGASAALLEKAGGEYISNFHALYGNACGLSLEDCTSLYGGICFATWPANELVALGLRLRYPDWIQTFFEMTHNIRLRALPVIRNNETSIYYLFGIPVLSRQDTCCGRLLCLFGKVPLLRVKRSIRNTEYYCLFGWLVLLKIKRPRSSA